MAVEKEKFRRLFPHLAKELSSGSPTRVDTVLNQDESRVKNTNLFQGYTPTAVDYLRRCEDEAQAEQTISYLERKKEVSAEYAELLRKQLREKGLRSFGAKKEDDYYLMKGGY
jgi:hypothetical protein